MGSYSSIIGGISNVASGDSSVVSGGQVNSVSGFSATISGGRNRNQAADYGWTAGSEGGTFDPNYVGNFRSP